MTSPCHLTLPHCHVAIWQPEPGYLTPRGGGRMRSHGQVCGYLTPEAGQ
jgi:hypothetical protein